MKKSGTRSRTKDRRLDLIWVILSRSAMVIYGNHNCTDIMIIGRRPETSCPGSVRALKTLAWRQANWAAALHLCQWTMYEIGFPVKSSSRARFRIGRLNILKTSAKNWTFLWRWRIFTRRERCMISGKYKILDEFSIMLIKNISDIGIIEPFVRLVKTSRYRSSDLASNAGSWTNCEKQVSQIFFGSNLNNEVQNEVQFYRFLRC